MKGRGGCYKGDIPVSSLNEASSPKKGCLIEAPQLPESTHTGPDTHSSRGVPLRSAPHKRASSFVSSLLRAAKAHISRSTSRNSRHTSSAVTAAAAESETSLDRELALVEPPRVECVVNTELVRDAGGDGSDESEGAEVSAIVLGVEEHGSDGVLSVLAHRSTFITSLSARGGPAGSRL